MLYKSILVDNERKRKINKSPTKIYEKPPSSRLYSEWKSKYYFFSKAELFFYRELTKYVNSKRALVLSKVRIADLAQPKHSLGNSEFHKVFRRITQKHVDYVITSYSGQILCVLELD